MTATTVRAGAGDRVFVPAAFAGRLAHMPAQNAAPEARAVWLATQLAELTAPAVVGATDGLTALRLATQVQRELFRLPGVR